MVEIRVMRLGAPWNMWLEADFDEQSLMCYIALAMEVYNLITSKKNTTELIAFS